MISAHSVDSLACSDEIAKDDGGRVSSDDAVYERTAPPNTLVFESTTVEGAGAAQSDVPAMSTTPVACGTTVVDVHEGFQDVDPAGYEPSEQNPAADGRIQQNELKSAVVQYVWVSRFNIVFICGIGRRARDFFVLFLVMTRTSSGILTNSDRLSVGCASQPCGTLYPVISLANSF